jgi:GTP cyclohydrolase IA
MARKSRGSSPPTLVVWGVSAMAERYRLRTERSDVTNSSPTERPADTEALDQGPPPAAIDHDRLAAAVREILLAIGEDPDRDGLQRTPQRVAEMYSEIVGGLHDDPARHLEVMFEADHDEMIMVRDISFASICEHHLVPFIGRAHVAYIPGSDGRITGLSKLARLVDGYAKRPQVQERLTSQVADQLMQRLEPRGALVVVEAEHLCMSMRGVRKPGALTVTSAVRGIFRSDQATRAEAMGLIGFSRDL